MGHHPISTSRALTAGTSIHMTQSAFHTTYRPDIDGLRAIAILAVIGFHAFPFGVRGGFIGVDVFFVISGFLISGIVLRDLERGDFSFREFYTRRIRRIFPALVVVLTACLIFGWFALLPDEYAQLGKHIVASAGVVQNFVLWEESGYFDVASELKPLLHLWSLAIEEQFYLLYPLLMWVMWRIRMNVVAAILFLATLSFGINIAGIRNDTIATFFLPHTRFWELLAGGALACAIPLRTWLSDKRHEGVVAHALSAAGLLLIVLAVFGLDKNTPFPGAWALLPVIGAALLIFAGPQAWVNRRILSRKTMVWIGLVSYPLYLWHWPLLSFARIMESDAPSLAISGTAVALSFLLAWLTYRWVERPIRFGRPSWKKTAALVLALVIIGYAGFLVSSRDGLTFRKSVRNLSEVARVFAWKPALGDSPECRRKYPELSPIRACLTLDAQKSPTVVILGDSHANRLFHGISSALANSGEVVMGLGNQGCPPFRGILSYDSDRGIAGEGTERGCEGTLRSLDFAEETASVHTVVLVGRWPLYTSTTGFGAAEGSWGMILARPGQRPYAKESSAVFESSMRETLARLSENNKRVVFILDIPELGFDPRSCADSRPLRLASKVRSPCAIPRSIFDERSHEYRDIVNRVVKDFPHVRVFDAAARLCDDQWCWAMKDGRMLYSDDDHLSAAGSEHVGETLAPLIRERDG